MPVGLLLLTHISNLPVSYLYWVKEENPLPVTRSQDCIPVCKQASSFSSTATAVWSDGGSLRLPFGAASVRALDELCRCRASRDLGEGCRVVFFFLSPRCFSWF